MSGSRLAQLSEEGARAVAAEYIASAVCAGRLPDETGFKPYFFAVQDLTRRYQFRQFAEGFLRDPSSLLVVFDQGPSLLFCFNAMVIDCGRARECECPFDFNWEPVLRSGAAGPK